MDYRMLLDPKGALKNKKKTEKSASTSSVKLSPDSDRPQQAQTASPSQRQTPSSANLSPTSPSRSAPYYDPKALLDPRNRSLPQEVRSSAMSPKSANGFSPYLPSAQAGPSTTSIGSPVAVNSSTPSLKRDNSNLNSKKMLEDMYNVESRSDQPRKRVKSQQDDADRGAATTAQKFNSSGTGIIGDYMKRRDDPDAQNRPTLIPAASATNGVVDLTNEIDNDDDDDIVVTGTNQKFNKEVYYGTIHTNADAYLIPKPRKKAALPSSTQWPPIACTLKRTAENAKTSIISVVDPFGRDFAKVEHKTAVALASLMDALPVLRTQPRLLNRHYHPGDNIHEPCSQTMKMTINMYGRRGDAEKLGKQLGHYNVWLIDSVMKDAGIETVNPHKIFANQKAPRMKAVTRVTGRNGIVEAGSEEETNQAVERIFDHFASENLEETDAPDTILTPLLPHQKQALTFMLRHESPPNYDDTTSLKLWSKKHSKKGVYYEEAVCNLTLENEPPPVSLGGLLADVMGLGKTIESLSLIAVTANAARAFSNAPVVRDKPNLELRINANAKGTLIICPMSTVANWETQIKEHLHPSFTWYTHHGQNRTKNVYELCKFDIVITTYGTLQSESKQGIDGVLRSLKWFRVILDEAHTIRESSALQSQACFELEADRRWCLTGTPIQNKLTDLGSLCQFLRLYPYDTVQNFQHYIVKRAGSGDSSFLKRLRIFIDSFTLRRQRDRINLPLKEDLQVAVDFSEAEQKLHEFFRQRSEIIVKDLTRNRDEGKKSRLQISVLQGITILRLISAHGRELLRDDDLRLYKGGDPNEPIDLDEDPQAKTMTTLEGYELFKMMVDADFDNCRNCDTPVTGRTPLVDGDSDTGPRCFVLPCHDLVCAPCFRQYQGMYDDEDDNSTLECPLCQGYTTCTYVPIEGNVDEKIETMQANEPKRKKKSRYTGPHSKTLALLEDIETMTAESESLEAAGEAPLKCVVFSEFTSHLDLIARALEDRGYRTARIDGSMTLPKRKKVLEALADDPTLTILLASIKAAGQGLNLTAASRAFIMEPLWNPAAEAQAVDRIYRIGQTRKVIVKRYHMKESIEESIMKLADKKQKLADLSMNRNHKTLSKKEAREQHYNEIRMLFESKKR